MSNTDVELSQTHPADQPNRQHKFANFVSALLVVKKWFLSIDNLSKSDNDANHNATNLVNEFFLNTDETPKMDNNNSKKSSSWLAFWIEDSGSVFYWWTAVVSIACLYNYVMIVIMVFEEVYHLYYIEWLIANGITDVVNILDILIQSRRAFRIDGVQITEPMDMLKHYIKRLAFLADLIAVLPTDLMLLMRDDLLMSRLNRLTKIYRVWDFIGLTEIRTNFPNAFRVLKLMTTCFIIFHWNGCLYFFLSILYNYNSAELDDWIFSYDKILDPVVPICESWRHEENCSFNEMDRNAVDRDKYLHELTSYWKNRTSVVRFSNFTKQYGLSFYWSALTLVTLGEQPWPNYTFQNTFEVIDTLIGLVIFAVIVGDVGNMVADMNAVKSEFELIFDGCKQYMIYRKVPLKLQTRVINWFGYTWEEGQAKVDEEAIAEFLPGKLYGHLAVYIHMDNLRRVKLFQDCEPGLLYELILMLRLRVYSPGDYVCKKGDIGKEMYIVKLGTLEVVSDDGKIVFVTLKEGTVFGELSILDIPGNKNGNRRTAAIRSVGFSDLYVLSKEDLWEALNEYPGAKELLLQKGRELLRKDNLLDEMSGREEEIDAHHNLEDRLMLMNKCVESIYGQLGEMYDDFILSTNDMKRRLTQLESTYINNRAQIEFDLKRNIQKQHIDNCEQ
ncbi:Cyclic nucleotide-gated cation channel alpha-3 [Toxocara canis]|uniref:Cyclic nucleotide-gated cation channel alpha-3 n=1 Tax=Toxocara canis TaxID=6265 RepID=A0A0B2VTS1_TOXCA|nr:Cyclic nucleotide-gated cation channel alpha-3 [Toxocara canis]